MRFKYSTTSPTQNEFDSLPRLPLSLLREDRRVEATALVGSGATVNVLPYDLGLQLVGKGLISPLSQLLILSQQATNNDSSYQIIK
jgi:hypothetical protein